MILKRSAVLVLSCLVLAVLPATTPRLAFESRQPQSTSTRSPGPTGIRNPEARKAVKAGLDQWGKGKLAEAQKYFERARRLAEASGDKGAKALAYDGFGHVAEDQGRLQDALTSYQTALELWPAANEPAQEALTHSNLGQLLLLVGQTNEALASFWKALGLLKLENDQDVRYEVFDGIGLALNDLKAPPRRALWAFESALKSARTPEQRGRIHNRLGNVYRDAKDLDRAWQEFSKSYALAKEGKDDRWKGYALADLAHVADLRGQDTAALRMFDEAFRILGPLPETLPKASILFGRAEALRDLHRLKEALSSVERSISYMEEVQADLVDPGQRVLFFSWRQRYYELYVTLLVDQYRLEPAGGWLEKAFEASERSRSRTLLDDVYAEPREATRGRHLEEVQRELGPDCTLLTYTLGDRGSFLWVVDQDKIAVFFLPERDQIEGVAEKAWTEFSESRSGVESASLSHIVLPDSVRPLLRRTLLISPDGALHKIPFAWLAPWESRSLALDHTVSNVPSGSYLVGMRNKLRGRQKAPLQLAMLADPVFTRTDERQSPEGPTMESGHFANNGAVPQRLDRLVFSRVEASEILKLVRPEERIEALGFDATRDALLSERLARAQIIHLSTHHIAGGHPEFSGLVMSLYDRNGRPQDGFVKESEIYAGKYPAELVVLSACETGLGENIRGEGPIGMTRAFLHAGARRVVVSLWNVDEVPTTELMTRFYRAMLHDRLPPAEALRSAQLFMAAHPDRYRDSWKAFVLQGEPR